MKSLRLEFEEAFKNKFVAEETEETQIIVGRHEDVALWAAKWAMERLRQEAHERDKQLMEYEIVALAQEMEQ